MKSVEYKTVASWILQILGVLFLLCVLAAFLLPPVGARQFKNSIEEAVRSPQSVKKLALADDVSTFPDEIKQLPNLEWLIVTGNEATELPI